MGSINKWLSSGYSLSHQHHHHSQSLNNNLHPDDIFEAFNNNPQSDHDQDWNMKEMSMNPLPCTNKNPNDHQNHETPKLENFLGVEGHSYTRDHNNQATDNYNGNDNIYNVYQGANNNNNGSNISSSMGLSMIKNWLRNNPQPAADNQNLSLCMSTGGSSDICKSLKSGDGASEIEANNDQAPKKSVDNNTFGQRTSIYRGVTRHRWTGRYEAHLWDNSHRREGQTRKGRQVYLGGYDKEEKAARAYDLAALKYWGTTTTTNFPISSYEKEVEEMKHMTRQEYVASLRRKSSGFSRGASIYRGVTRHHQHGRWQARIGRVAGNKDLYLGTFSTQEEAAEAYDIAAIKFRGLNAVTNFEINRYDVKSILESSALPIGGAAKRLKDAENAEMALQMHLLQAEERNLINLQLTDDHRINGYGGLNNSTHFWPINQPSSIYQRFWCKQEQDSQVNHGFNEFNNLMSLDSNNPAVYGENAVQMMGTVIVNDQNQPNGFVGNDEGLFGSADYHARSLYYQSDQQSSSNGIANCNNWISSGGVPNLLASTANTTAVCHGGSTFTVWNDT